MGGVRAGTAMYSRHARIGSSRPQIPGTGTGSVATAYNLCDISKHGVQ